MVPRRKKSGTSCSAIPTEPSVLQSTRKKSGVLRRNRRNGKARGPRARTPRRIMPKFRPQMRETRKREA